MKNRAAILQLFIANFISGIAQGITMIAIPWYFTKSGNMAFFTYMYMGSNMISLAWSPYAGTLIDNFNRKKIFLYICGIVGVVELLICFFGWQTGGLTLYGIGAVFILTSLNYNIHFNNLYAFTQEIVEESYIKKITSYLEIASQVATLCAGATAAFLLEGTSATAAFPIKAWSIEEIFLLDAFTYFIAFGIIYFIDYQSTVVRNIENDTFLERINLGFSYLKKEPTMFLFGTLSLNIFATLMVLVFACSPMYVRYELHEGGDAFAIAELSYGLGAILAGVAIQRIFGKMEVTKSVIVMTIVTIFCYLLMLIFPVKMLFFFLLFVLGLTNAGTRVQRMVYLFKKVPNQYFGRVNSAFSLINMLTRICFIGIVALPWFLNENVSNIFYVFMSFLAITVFFLVKKYKSMVE
jgi:MFS transporter, DHA3 family, macrolide efflux protein